MLRLDLRKATFGTAGALIAVTIGLGIWAYVSVPAEARIPIHWNAAGEVDGYAGRWTLFLVPAVAIAVTLLLAVLPAIEPRRGKLLASAGLYNAAVLGLNGMMVVVQAVTVAAALGGTSTLGGRPIPVAAGTLMLVLGIFMRGARSNFLVGIRTPWTLTSEITWRKTHQVGGVMFIAAGAAIATSGFLAADLVVWVILGAVGLAALVPIVYSYFVWRGAPDKVRGGDVSRAT
jgi:immunity protein, SdpI family